MANTVLSNFSVTGFGRARMLTQMAEVFEKNAQNRSTAIANRYNARINSIDLTKNRWRSVQEGIQKSRSVLSTTIARAKSILSNLDLMISAVTKAGQNSEDFTGPEAYAAAFDSYLKGLDGAATSSTVKPNLLGVAKQELDYRVGINGTTTTVPSAFVGSDYYIIDSEGKYWDLDRSAKILKRYDEFPDEPTSTSGNFETGLRLDSISGDDISFTVGANTASPQSFSGTLYRKGLQILDSWAYDRLATEEGRTRALEDLNDAKVAIKLEIRRYQVAFTMSNFYDKVAGQSISGMNKKTTQLMVDQAIDIQKEQNRLAREYQAATSSVMQSIALQNQYAKMLNPLFADKATNSLISIWA